MSDYLLPLFVAAALFVWWLSSSRSLVGTVARTPETEAALADVVAQVEKSLEPFGPGAYVATPVWAHGCPCVRVSVAPEGAAAPAGSPEEARRAAARALEDAVRASPAFAHIAARYKGEEGLHWY